MTGLHFAAYSNDIDEVRLQWATGIAVDARSDNGWTPLLWSIDMSQVWGQPEPVVAFLLANGAADLPVTVKPDQITTRDHDSMTSVRLTSADLTSGFSLVGPRIVSHAGYVQEAVAGIRSGSAAWQISLSQQPPDVNQNSGTK